MLLSSLSRMVALFPVAQAAIYSLSKILECKLFEH